MALKPAVLLAALCLAGLYTAHAAPLKKCTVVGPGEKVPATGVVGWKPLATTATQAGALAFVAGELFEADPHFSEQQCPPHTGLTPDERMKIWVLGGCSKVNLETQSSPYRLKALIGYPCKGRKASILRTRTGTYKCPKDRFCVKTYVTADVPFSFDFTALSGMAAGGEGEGEGYGEVLSNILDLHLDVKRFP